MCIRDSYALATRLSYFLWKSLPDDQLFLLASEGALSDPAVLASEVDRLLDDEKSLRFVEDFLDQWLELEDIDATTPDERLYPEYDDLLRQAMLEETRRFFAELIWDDPRRARTDRLGFHLPESTTRRALRHPRYRRARIPKGGSS